MTRSRKSRKGQANHSLWAGLWASVFALGRAIWASARFALRLLWGLLATAYGILAARRTRAIVAFIVIGAAWYLDGLLRWSGRLIAAPFKGTRIAAGFSRLALLERLYQRTAPFSAAALIAPFVAMALWVNADWSKPAPIIVAFDGDDVSCLALNIYHEARGESEDGRLAVGHVVVNRARDRRFPSKICDVVQQGGENPRNACQFSWWCDGRSDQPEDALAWQQSMVTAGKILDGETIDPTAGALWYHADYVKPTWRDKLAAGPQIGTHLFYYDPNGI